MKDELNKKSYKIVRGILSGYTFPGLPEERQREVQAWLVSDFHTKEKEEVLWSLWNEMEVVDRRSRKKAWSSVCRKLELRQPVSLAINKTYWYRVAAVVLPFLLLSAGAYWLLTKPYNEEHETTYAQQITVKATDGLKHIHLADSTEVWLNVKSELTYTQDRQVTLAGEAYFHVKHRGEELFTVIAEGVKVAVTGTRFNVRAYPDASESIVSLYEGGLHLLAVDTMLVMQPGDEWTVNRQMNTLQAGNTNRTAPGWQRKFISYEEIPVLDIFKDLETRYQVSIQGGSQKLLNDTVILKYEEGATIDEVMFLLSQISGKFKYTITDHTISIRETK